MNPPRGVGRKWETWSLWGGLCPFSNSVKLNSAALGEARLLCFVNKVPQVIPMCAQGCTPYLKSHTILIDGERQTWDSILSDR